MTQSLGSFAVGTHKPTVGLDQLSPGRLRGRMKGRRPGLLQRLGPIMRILGQDGFHTKGPSPFPCVASGSLFLDLQDHRSDSFSILPL